MEIIAITESLTLESITSNGYEKLYRLMYDIYPKTYAHFWTDNGDWYVNMLYNPTNIQQELMEENAAFYFVNFEHDVVGILRIQYHETYPKYPDRKATKLHRIYLDPKTHRKGIGKALINWTKEQAKLVGDEILWLEGMDTQSPAISFYEKMGFQIGSHVILPHVRILVERRGMHQMWLSL